MRARRGLVLVAAIALLSGCATTSDPGGSPTADGTPAPTATSSPEPSASPEPSPTTGAELPADLTIVLDETGSGVTRTMTLTCAPTGGDHPDAAAACATLAAVGADAFAQPPRDEMCTEQWGGPQVATVEGSVDGTSVRARFSRTNGCEIRRWDSVATVLGSPGGGM